MKDNNFAEKRRCVIIGGAPIGAPGEIRSYIRPDDYVVACDSGLYNASLLGVTPSLIVGDFDSHPAPDTPVETITLPCEKDDTDTVYAVREAERRGFCDFLLLGVTGGRLDHTLGNVSILLYLNSRGHTGMIADDTSEMKIVSSAPVTIDDRFSFFSLLNISGEAEDITITGAKYPLSGARISCEYQYGISNEVKKGMTATVTVGRGRLLLIMVRHE